MTPTAPTPRRLLWLGLVVLSIAAWPGRAAIAAPPADAQTPSAAEPSAGATRGAILADPAYERLRGVWGGVQRDLMREAWGEAAGRADLIVRARNELGLPNIYPFSSALLHSAEEANRQGLHDAAKSLSSAAGVISPSMIAPQSAQARYAFLSEPFDPTSQMKYVRGQLNQLSGDLTAGLAVMGNAAAAFVYTILILLFVFGLAMLGRYTALMAMDLRRLLPAGVTQLQASLFVLALLTVPLMLGAGLIFTTALWLSATVVYQRTSERILTFVLLLLGGCLPMGTATTIRSMSYPGTPHHTIHTCFTSLCAEEDLADVKGWVKVEVLPYETNLTTGAVLTRRAAVSDQSYGEAMRYALEADRLRTTATSQTLLGNLEYLKALRLCPTGGGGDDGDWTRWSQGVRQALAFWESALNLDPESLPALYNSSIVLRQLERSHEATMRFDDATHRDADGVLNFNEQVAHDTNTQRCTGLNLPNRHIMPPTPPTGSLLHDLLNRPVPDDGLVINHAGVFTGEMGGRASAGSCDAAAVLVILLWVLALAVRYARYCTTCGRVADPRSRLDTPDGHVCEACVHREIRRALLDPKEQWFRDKEIAAEHAQAARRIRRASWFIPGLGHLLAGAPIRGLFILTTFSLCVIVGLGLHHVVVDPRDALGIGTGRLAIFGVMAAVTYLLALLDAHALSGVK